MEKEKIKFSQLLKSNAMRIIYVMAYMAIMVAAGRALFFSTNIIRIQDGKNEQVILSTKSSQEDVIQLAGLKLADSDSVMYTSFDDNYCNLTVRHAFEVPITVDGEKKKAKITQGTVADCLAAAEVVLGEYDYTEPSLHAPVSAGDSIRVYRVKYVDNQYDEVVPYGTTYKKSSLLFKRKSRTYTLQEGSNGMNTVTYRERYVDGELELALVSKVEVVKKPTNALVLSYGAGVPVSEVSAPAGASISGGVPTGYSRVYSMSATGYYSAKGKGASGLGLYYGTVAVNPNLIPYGTKMYIASPDGQFVYGWAIATDTGGAMMNDQANIDLFYETYTESYLNGRIPVNVYIYG